MSDEPKAAATAAPMRPVFLDGDALPLPLPRTVTKTHLSEHYDLKSWLAPDAEDATTGAKKP
jgi:hypothetical protein